MNCIPWLVRIGFSDGIRNLDSSQRLVTVQRVSLDNPRRPDYVIAISVSIFTLMSVCICIRSRICIFVPFSFLYPISFLFPVHLRFNYIRSSRASEFIKPNRIPFASPYLSKLHETYAADFIFSSFSSACSCNNINLSKPAGSRRHNKNSHYPYKLGAAAPATAAGGKLILLSSGSLPGAIFC